MNIKRRSFSEAFRRQVILEEALPAEPVRATLATPGSLKIELPRTRIEVIGQVHLDALHAVLAALRPR